MKLTSGFKRVVLLCGVMMTASIANAGEGRIRQYPNAIKDEYIVVLSDDVPRDAVPATARALAAQAGGSLKRIWQDAVKGFFIKMTEGQAFGLSHDPKISYIEQNSQMFMSSSVPTNVDPGCDPPSPCLVGDNRLWHLDVLDQSDAIPSYGFSYCEDLNSTTAYVYVLDGGVLRAHREFGNDANRVKNGYNASGDNHDNAAGVDYYPAYDPCHGPPVLNDAHAINSFQEIWTVGHGTGVGSVVAGSHVGVAPHAVIVPIKANRCAEWAAKIRDNSNNNTHFDVGAWIWGPSQSAFLDTYYVCVGAGTTAATVGANDANFHFQPWASPVNGIITDGTVQWQQATTSGPGQSTMATVQMQIEGLDWILRTGTNGNPYPKSPAVVSMSMFQVVGNGSRSVNCVNAVATGCTTTLEAAILALLNNNITVVASANNQDADACDTSPGRLSRDNPTTHPTTWKVITAGGTMLRNNPDPNPATGGAANAPEPAYDRTQPTRFARWRCGAGDSGNCSADITNPTSYTTPNPNTDPNGYQGWTLGSNGGLCVSLFAPAKNIPVAALLDNGSGGATMYRNPRVSGGDASGTSWSAPYVAGVAARILQSNPTYNVDQLYTALINQTSATLDSDQRDPPGVTGTPNRVLQLPDASLSVDALPATNNGSVTAVAHSGSPVTYKWYQIYSGFDITQHHSNAAADDYLDPWAATLVPNQTSATLTLNPLPAVNTSYFVRVYGSCGSVDSTYTTFSGCQAASISTQPAASPAVIGFGRPSTLTIGLSGSPATVQWYTSDNVNVGSGTSLVVHPSTTTTYHATVSNSCTQTITSSTITVTVLTPPGGFSAHTNSDGSSISLSWSPVTGATLYQVWKSSTWNGTFSLLTTTTTTTASDGPFTGPATTFVYLVYGTNGAESSAASAKDYATVAGLLFNDATITAGRTLIAKQHIIDLRAAVDAVRAALGATPMTWQDPLTYITANSIAEVRNSLDAARGLSGVNLGNYPYSSSIAAQGFILKTQMDESREAVK